MNIESLRVNGKRLKKSLELMAGIGATPGRGVSRLALSAEECEARANVLLKCLMKSANE